MAPSVRPSTPVLESLEPRIVLSAVDGLPDLADLEVSTDPVVVLETSFGDIYIELFEQDAPLTVENFIQYTQLGQYSESLFHRSRPGFVLQGGGFAFDNDLGFQSVFDTDLAGEFVRIDRCEFHFAKGARLVICRNNDKWMHAACVPSRQLIVLA